MKTESPTSFDQWLAAVMKRNKITASKLARMLKCHHNVVRSWQRGRNLPNGYYIANIIVVLEKETGENFTQLCETCFHALIEHHKPK